MNPFLALLAQQLVYEELPKLGLGPECSSVIHDLIIVSGRTFTLTAHPQRPDVIIVVDKSDTYPHFEMADPQSLDKMAAYIKSNLPPPRHP